MKRSKNAAGIFLALLSGIFWGFSGSCGQYLFTYHSVDSQWLVAVRMLASGIILLVFSAFRHKRDLFAVFKKKKHIIRLAAFTLLGLVMCQYSYFEAIELSNAGTATVLQYLSPALILVFLCIKNKKPPVFREAVAIVLAIGGTFIIATGSDIGSLSISSAALIWGLLSAVFLVCYSLIPVPLLEVADTSCVLGLGMTAGGLMLLPIFRPWENMPQINFSFIGALAGIIIIGTVLAYSFYLKGIHLIGATKASIISSVEPVAATVISAVWLGTDFSFADIVGFAMIISTVFIISIKKEPKQ